MIDWVRSRLEGGFMVMHGSGVTVKPFSNGYMVRSVVNMSEYFFDDPVHASRIAVKLAYLLSQRAIEVEFPRPYVAVSLTPVPAEADHSDADHSDADSIDVEFETE